jgi:hypothetical protein
MFAITYVDNESTAWSRNIEFKYEDQEYEVTLSWSEYGGYEITFFDSDGKETNPPKWFDEWNTGLLDSVEYALDCASLEAKA